MVSFLCEWCRCFKCLAWVWWPPWLNGRQLLAQLFTCGTRLGFNSTRISAHMVRWPGGISPWARRCVSSEREAKMDCLCQRKENDVLCHSGSLLCFWNLDVFGGVQLWWRAREAIQHGVTDGLLCDLQVEQKTETVCNTPDFTNLLCPRLGGLQNQQSYLPRRGKSQTRWGRALEQTAGHMDIRPQIPCCFHPFSTSRWQQSHYKQCDIQVEQVNKVLWGSPAAANIWGVWLGVLHGWALPLPRGCQCLWWTDHIRGLGHLCLGKRKLPRVPDNQGMQCNSLFVLSWNGTRALPRLVEFYHWVQFPCNKRGKLSCLYTQGERNTLMKR